MKLMKKACCSKDGTGARVIDGSLVLSYPNASEPVVWRMNLAQAKEAGFEIKEAAGKFKLVQKSGVEVQDIASFNTRESAVNALMDVSNALQGGRKAANDSGPMKTETAQWLIAIVGVLIVIGLFGYLSNIAPVEGGPGAATTTASSTTSTPTDPEKSSGVPVSADDFLKGQ
jgi:hypothetical protein